MSNQCGHGHLRRSCEICQRDEEIERLKAERDALRADAERYRWLRDGGLALLPYDDHGMGPEFDFSDAAIDAVRGEK